MTPSHAFSSAVLAIAEPQPVLLANATVLLALAAHPFVHADATTNALLARASARATFVTSRIRSAANFAGRAAWKGVCTKGTCTHAS